MADRSTENPTVSEIVKRWDESQKHHALFVKRWERNERSYRGVLMRDSEAPKWRHQYHPPYAFNLIETIVANTVEMGLKFDVRPAPRPGTNIEEATRMLERADAVGSLLRHQHRVDEMDYKQRPLYLCNSIGGRGIGKSHWALIRGTIREQTQGVRPIYGANDEVLGHVPTIEQIERDGVLRDHSTFEVVDPRDFVIHESAKALQPWEPGGAQYVFHRCWYSIDQLKQLEKDGFFSNVDDVNETRDQTGEYQDRESEVFNINREKDLIEVLEYWCIEDGVVHRAYVANRRVLLRDKDQSPFWHGGYPFVVSSSMPAPFSTYGMSDIELIAQLQEMMWKLASQRFDNLELINNMITVVRSDVDDPDAFEYYPGARWQVDGDPSSAVMAFQPPYQLAEVSLSAEALVKGDLQNVTSAAPFAGGTETASVDQKTATGASIVMNAAQQRLVAKKYQAQQGLKQEAWMRIKNCQQFINDRYLASEIGADGAHTFRDIDPLDIQGEFVAELTPMGESQMRQERRAEGTQFFQVVLQAAPLYAAAQTPLNLKELFGWMAKRWDIDDWERFFSQQQAAMGAAQGMQGAGAGGGVGAPAGAGPQGNPMQAMQPNLGVTSGAAVDASSPSAAGGMSLSPALAMQRAGALSGGVMNNGGGG